ncbi:MAG: putative Co/Zn/Cd efflux system membrane fusion protein [Candidatus Jettenia ecosi]|uniref:Putative Co/Zn/Cd efflux system membrane fusion protein n=1 Tax=Candidatus Jettenia ecosi TaxID=2494326 RepID=A0A533QEA0_9BACT|nr:MAG: putative Co/Zn/Cd efflux system membrane fusion protein [Candidatus Jettenia ecosi]
MKRTIPILICVSLMLVSGCIKSEKQAEQSKEQAVPVIVSTVIQKDVPIVLHSIGTVEAYSTVSVVSQVEGMLTRVYFKEGQYVKKGQLLFTIDPRPYEVALKKAQADLEKNITQAKNAEAQYYRYTELIKAGIVTKEEYDQANTNAEALKSIVNADKASLEIVKLQLNYCFIRSPINGRTGALMVDQGNIVKANEEPALVIINQVSPIYVSFSIPEQELHRVKSYMDSGELDVKAVIPGDENHSVAGSIAFIDNEIDRTTGTIRLKAVFTNSDHRLWPGQFVNIMVNLAIQPNAVVVPSQAVQAGQHGQYVFVVGPDLTGEYRPVVTGRMFEGESVVEKGLQPGERVVVDGQLRLTSGTKVEVKRGLKEDG